MAVLTMAEILRSEGLSLEHGTTVQLITLALTLTLTNTNASLLTLTG